MGDILEQFLVGPLPPQQLALLIDLDYQGVGTGSIMLGAPFDWYHERNQMIIEHFSSEPRQLTSVKRRQPRSRRFDDRRVAQREAFPTCWDYSSLVRSGIGGGV